MVLGQQPRKLSRLKAKTWVARTPFPISTCTAPCALPFCVSTWVGATSAPSAFLELPPPASPFSFLDWQLYLLYLGENCPGFGTGFAGHSPHRDWRDFVIHWMANVTLKYEVFKKIKLENMSENPVLGQN